MTEPRYTAKTPTGETLTGTAPEIARLLQAQDWQPGDGGVDGERRWREKVAGRVQIQTGRTIPTESVDGFLLGLAAAGLLTLEQAAAEGSAEAEQEETHANKHDANKRDANKRDADTEDA